MGVRAWPGEIVDYVVADARSARATRTPVADDERRPARLLRVLRRRRAAASDEVPPARIASP
jgi:hypothetical protein